VKTAPQTTTGAPRARVAPVAGGTVVLGRYRLVERLGAGGFGVVWLAHDERLDRSVAVKRIPMHDAATAARAEREGLVAARLAHPGIVALFEAGRDDEAVYLVSELVRGRALAELLEEGALSDRDVLVIGVALCDAVAHAHSRGVVHRDVKPGNVLVPEASSDGAGVAKLTDFGVALMAGDEGLTRTGDVVGTLAYMAPEQAAGRSVGPPADLYALGLVVFEALAGVNPVRGPGAAATARRVGRRLPPLRRLRGDLPPELCAAIDRAVAVRPELRGGIGDLRAALARALPDVGDEPGTVVASRLRGRGGDDGGVGARAVVRDDGGARARAAVRDEGAVGARAVVRDDGAEGARAVVRDDGGVGAYARPPAPDPEPTAPRRPRAPVSLGGRVVAALGGGALAAAGLAWLGPAPAVTPVAGGAAAALAIALLPRAGWLAATAGLAAWLALTGAAGVAMLVVAAALPPVLLLGRSGPLWPAPALAPVLGLAALAGAWPALAGQAARAWQRAALGALGMWWLLLAEALSGSRLALGGGPGVEPRDAWEASAGRAAADVLAPALAGGALMLAAVWALAAALLPTLVRGRAFALDLVGATVWAAALGSATQAVAAALAWPGGPPAMRGLVAGAVAAGAVAVAARASRGEA
jgi:hypothetical protein